MSTLTKILEEARALQLRNGVTAREALALAMAGQRRMSRAPASIGDDDMVPMHVQMPAASCLDGLLPRDREPTIEEIREAWKACMEQSGLYGGAERFQELADMSAGPFDEKP